MNDIVDAIDRDYVEVAGTRVLRPSRISPMQWLEFWEDAWSERDGDGAVVPMVASVETVVSVRKPRSKKR